MKKHKIEDGINGFDEWGGYMAAKKSKLEEQFAQDAMNNPYKESDLFAGISIFVNGLTNPSADELKRIMMRNGGVYHTYQRSSTRFVIATNLPDVKVRQITSAKIISPQWVVDCLKENKILDYAKYLLYTNCKTSQPKIAFGAAKANATVTKCDSIDFESKNILDSLNFLNTAIRQDRIGVEDKPANTVSLNASNSVHDDSKKARTAVDPNFLSEFYNNSRLHHIATLGAGFKHHVSKLRESHKGGFPARDQLIRRQTTAEPIAESISMVIQTRSSQLVMHIDMDCFFVSVGLRSRPHLRGLPVAVTHSKGAAGNKLQSAVGVDRKREMEMYVKRHDDRYKTDHSAHLNDEDRGNGEMPAIDNATSLSEIASCSYEARKMGIKNGMFVGAALKLCPDLKTIPYDFDAYKEVAYKLYDTITQYTLDVEAVSCDEMYVNLTEILKETHISVDEFVTHVRNEITTKTQCPCSAGVGANKLQARMATKKAKPNGQFHLSAEKVEEYFNEVPISDLPGVGYSTTLKLKNSNLKTCFDLRKLPLSRLQQDFGKKLGETLHQYCRGIDNKPLVYDQIRKSVSAEVNYGIRFTETSELDTFLKQLCGEVHNRLTEIDAKGRTITLKFMVRAADAPVETAKFMGHGFCDNVTKSTTLPASTNELAVITQTVFSIKNALNVPAKELRGIGIQISKLDSITTAANKEPKLNTLKTMFQKVIEKNQSNANDRSTNNHLSREDVRIEQKISTLRKTKSFDSPSTSRRIGDMFAIVASKPKLESHLSELDLDVLAQLPDEIREEVLRDQNLLMQNMNTDIGKTKPNRKPTARKIEDDFQMNQAIEASKNTCMLPSVESISPENILNQPNWRPIMTAWLESTSEPIECDTQTIAGYFGELMKVRRLSEVHLCLRFLHRKISESYAENCRWHHVYYKVVNIVQHHMAGIYGENCSLYIENGFNCKSCTNKDSILF